MNSKANIFTVLQRHDDSDDERRPTKKEYRAIDKNLREGQGDTVNKDPYAAKQHKPHHGTTAPSRDGKREFDRKSGTVKQAFGNSRQKGGKREDDREIRRQNKDNAEGHEEDHEGAEEQAEEEDESTKAISMEDYLKERNLLEDTRAEEQQDLNLAKIQQDTGMKVMNKKTAPVETGVIKKNNDISALSRAPQNSIYGSNREAAPADRVDRDRDGERGGRGRGGRGRGGPRGGRGGPRRDDREERTERTEKTDKPEGQEAAEGDQKERKPFRGGDRADRGGDRTDKGGDRADRGDRGSPRGGRGGRGGSRGGQGGQGAPQQPRSHKSGNTNLTADDFPKL